MTWRPIPPGSTNNCGYPSGKPSVTTLVASNRNMERIWNDCEQFPVSGS